MGEGIGFTSLETGVGATSLFGSRQPTSTTNETHACFTTAEYARLAAKSPVFYRTGMNAQARWLDALVPPADKPVARWHVSPFVDVLAYHFSWLLILLPLALAGDMHPKDYLGLWVLGMSASFLHRYYTMPYVYLDVGVFSQQVTRFTLYMGLLTLACVTSAYFYKWTAPPGFYRPVDVMMVVACIALLVQTVAADRRGHALSRVARAAVASPFVIGTLVGLLGGFTEGPAGLLLGITALAAFASVVLHREEKRGRGFVVVTVSLALASGVAHFAWDVPLNDKPIPGSAIIGFFGAFAALWNVWHTLMQKFGILRVYAAKSSVPLENRTPPWVDRLLVFGSLPFLALYLAPAQRPLLVAHTVTVRPYLLAVLDAIIATRRYLLPLSGAFALFSIACFVHHERKADGLRGTPRLSMALGLTLLNASFFVTSPLKVYIAYGFSHAIEYMVFVWAFLRRRYAQPSEHEPLLKRILRRPLLAYATFTMLVGGGYFVIAWGGEYGLHAGGVTIGGIKLGTWLFCIVIWHSIAHFYFDGFLWKMRAPSVRASL